MIIQRVRVSYWMNPIIGKIIINIRAIFNFTYNLITDFIPTILIGKLFTPKQEKYSSSLLKVDDWDIVSTV